MIPILYEYNETEFTSHGLCYLPDCTDDEVVEQRNGQNELSLRYPITGANFGEIRAERIVGVYANDSKKIQGYRIYSITRPLNGLVTIYARHVAYDLSGVPCPIIDGNYSAVAAMNLLFAGTSFTAWSDIQITEHVKMNTPISVMSMLGGTEGSILDLFGGEFEFDNFTVKLHQNRGADNGVVVEYGKNITQLTDEFSVEDVYSSILPYATYYTEDGTEVTVRGTKTSFGSLLARDKCAIVDFTDKFDYEAVPTVEALDTMAQQYIEANHLGTTESNINVSFIPLWYDNGGDAIALCDTIYIKHDRLGVDARAKVIETTYDCLRERFTRVTCGKATSNFVRTVVEMQEEDSAVKESVATMPGRMAQAIAHATRLITGNSGGNVVLHEGANGRPYELLIMDNADINQAVNVWRWNLGGLGFSSNGYAGPYETAITSDGQINADLITTGELSADRITAGVLSDAQDKNTWNFNTGRLTITDGVITATHVQTFEHTDYSQTDLDTLDDFMSGAIYDLTEAQMDKYDIDGNGIIDQDDYDRIEWMITEASDIDRTITTTIDPSQHNKAVQISTSVPATGSVAAKVIESYYSGAQTHSSTVKCDRVVFTGDTHAVSIASEFSEEISIGQPTIRPWGATDLEVDVPNALWTGVNSVSLPPGLWYVTAVARFTANTTGRRQVCVSFTRDSSDAATQGLFATQDAISDVRTSVACSGPVYLSEMRNLYMNCYQNSGSKKSTLISFTAVRLV